MGYNSLANWYSIVHLLRFYHSIQDSTILNWLPFERDINVDLIVKQIKGNKTNV